MRGRREAAHDASMIDMGSRTLMLGEFAGNSRVLEAGGFRTSLVDVGEGAPLLLLHGGIECGGAMWGTVLPALARDHHVVAPDVPGLGESDPTDRLDVATFKEWLTVVIRATGLDRPVLVAHSTIGSLAARFAALRTGLISRLIVYAAPAVGPYRMPLGLRYVGIRFGLRPSPRNAERFERFALLDLDSTRRRDPAWFDAFDAYNRARAGVPHVKKTMRTIVGTQTKQIPDTDLDCIDVPTTLLWGRQDRMVPLAIGQAAAMRHAWPLHVIDDAAHVPHMEQPDAFVASLQSILATA